MREIALALLLLAGCSGARPGQPPEISFGRSECARCGMIISDDRFAGGYVSDAGESVAYDDLGELLAELEASPALRARAWVRDFAGAGWLRLESAHALRVPDFPTPMGTGWVAFASREAAEAFAKSRSAR